MRLRAGIAAAAVALEDAEPVLLELLGGSPPITPTVRTGSGRRHFYFQAPPNGLAKAARDGLELRVGSTSVSSALRAPRYRG